MRILLPVLLLVIFLSPSAARAAAVALPGTRVPGSSLRSAAIVGTTQAGSRFLQHTGLNSSLLRPGMLTSTFSNLLTPSLASVYAVAERFKAGAFAGAVKQFYSKVSVWNYKPTPAVLHAAAKLPMPARDKILPRSMRHRRVKKKSGAAAETAAPSLIEPGKDIGPSGKISSVRGRLKMMNKRIGSLRQAVGKGGIAMAAEGAASFDGAATGRPSAIDAFRWAQEHSL